MSLRTVDVDVARVGSHGELREQRGDGRERVGDVVEGGSVASVILARTETSVGFKRWSGENWTYESVEEDAELDEAIGLELSFRNGGNEELILGADRRVDEIIGSDGVSFAVRDDRGVV